MSEKIVSVEVGCSWETGNQKTLKNAVSLSPLTDYNRNEEGTLTDMVDLDSCLLLTQPTEENGNQKFLPQSCSITLQLLSNSPIIINTIVVVCEARIIEVYGQHDEYLSTVSADFLDEVDDMSVYCAEISLTQMARECTLKFARLRKASEMWLYGLKVIWNFQDKERRDLGPTSSVNFETVEQRLKESQTTLSNRAESCKQFLKMYSSLSEEKKPMHGFADPLTLLSLLPASQRRGNLLQGSAMKMFTQALGNGNNNMTPNKPPDTDVSKEDESFCCQKCTQHIEAVLDKKLMMMETRLLKAFDDRLVALQEHQNKHIEKLFVNISKGSEQSSKQFVPKASSSIGAEDDSRVEEIIKLMMKQKGILTDARDSFQFRNTCGDSNDIIRNALFATQFNGEKQGPDDRNSPCFSPLN